MTELNETSEIADQPTASATVAVNKLSDEDRLNLQLANARRETVLAQAKEALAKNDTADIAYKYFVLQLYMRYQLTELDTISENGDIVRGGAVQQTTPAQK